MSKFRRTFEYSQRIFWYPQHQNRALEQLKKGLHQIDFVIEVRDARIPLTSINRQFDAIFHRRKLVIYNKCDLVNVQLLQRLISKLELARNESILTTNCLKQKGLNAVIGHLANVCKEDPIRFPYLSIVVVGAPNVGKSSLVNGLRKLGVHKGKATLEGKKAGVTTRIQTRIKINEDPPIYLHDTPGIFNPHITTPIEGLKVALTGATSDSLTTMMNVADYLLFRLNNCGLKNVYPKIFGLKEPTDDIHKVCEHISIDNGFRISEKSRIARLIPDSAEDLPLWDLDRGAEYFVEQYRQGVLGKMILDDLSPESIENWLRMSATPNEIK